MASRSIIDSHPSLCLTLTLVLIGASSVNAVCSNRRCDATLVERAVTVQGNTLENIFRMYPGQDGSDEIHEGDRNVNIICEVAADRAAAISVVHSTPGGSEQCWCQPDSGESSMGYRQARLVLPSPSAGDMVFCVGIPPPSRNNENMELIKSPPQTVQHRTIDSSQSRIPKLPNPTTLTTTEIAGEGIIMNLEQVASREKGELKLSCITSHSLLIAYCCQLDQVPWSCDAPDRMGTSNVVYTCIYTIVIIYLCIVCTTYN